MNLNPRSFWLFFLFFMVLSFCPEGNCTTYYVDSTSSEGEGTSWNKAFPTLQAALDVAISGDEIWVAKGTYFPDKDILGNIAPTDPRTKTFYISDDIKIYGGFNGTENQRSERDPILHLTVLSGDLGLANDTIDNAYHVVYFKEVSRDCALNGFTIEQGNAGGTFGSADGAGIFIDANGVTTSPSISRCVISRNYAHGKGGGASIHASNGTADPLFYRVFFKDNYAYHSGAVDCHATGTTGVNYASFINCVFYDNHVETSGGAFVSNTSSGGTSNNNLLFCTFTKNSAILFGSAMRMLISGGGGANTSIVKNCIFFDNSELANSVDIFKTAAVNLEIDFCSTEGSDCGDLVDEPGFVCGANMLFDVDPMFLDPYCCSAEVSSASLVIDEGVPLSHEGTPIKFDYFGNDRPLGGTVDIGAHEFDPNLSDPYILAQNQSLELFECPGDDKYFLTGELSQFVFFLDDVNGTNLEKINACGRYVLDLSMYNPGTYFIRAEHISNSELDIQLMVEVD